MTKWKWNGSKWWKFDFHTHSPASDDYGRGSNQSSLKGRTPKEWLLDYMRAGVDCVAITDHNTGAWIDLLKKALNKLDSEHPEGYRPIHIFPGVEISVHGGVHLLAILDTKKSTSDVDSLLGAAGFSGTKGSCNDITNRSFTEVVEDIVKAGGIAIPAHVDCEKGLFKLNGQTLEQVLKSKGIFAMELMEAEYQKPGQYNNKKLKWTEILGVGSSRVDLQACKLEYSIVSPK